MTGVHLRATSTATPNTSFADIELIGRRREAHTLRRLLGGMSDKRGGALIVRGEVGIGKTALLRSVQPPPGTLVLPISGVEFEKELAFSALHQLCSPILPGISRLPEPQRHSLESAFGRRAEGQPDHFLIGLAALGLLSEAATERPLLCVIDDAQWLDQETAHTLAFVARRLRNEPIVVVFALREPNDRSELTGLPELRLEGLAEEDARKLLSVRYSSPFDGPVCDCVIAEAQGNPLALRELSRAADAAGGFTSPGTGSHRSHLEAGLQKRLAELPQDTRLLLLLAAADPTGDPVLLWRAAGHLAITPAAGTPAIDAGLVSLGLWVRFSHPLVRSALWRDASPVDRRTAHGALASAMADGGAMDRWAWHHAQALTGPDEDAARALEHSAGRARARGGIAAAAAFLEKAVELTTEPRSRVERALNAAEAKRDSGALDAALSLLSVAETAPRDDMAHARAGTLRARIALDLNRDATSVAKLQRAAELMAPLDPALAREISLETLTAARSLGRFAHRPLLSEAARAVRSALSATQPARPLDHLLDSLAIHISDGFVAAAPLLRRVLDVYLRGEKVDSPSPDVWCVVCGVAMDLWDDVAWQELADRHIHHARAAGVVTALPIALSYRALAHIHVGEFSEAAEVIEEAHRVAIEVGTPGLACMDTTLAAWRGDQGRTAELATAAQQDAVRRGEGRVLTALEYARATLFNGLGRYDAALEACRPAYDLDEAGFHAWGPVEFIEAAARSGNPGLAVPALEKLVQRTQASPTDWALGMELRSRALLSSGDDVGDLYQEAVRRLDLSRAAVHAARARLLYGEWLRRRGYRLEARTHLSEAHTKLTSIGADAFAARAARELRATGVRPGSRRAGVATRKLTAQELRIARLVASGATSKEVGMQLFLSPRTIDAHLRSIFRKLSISSRRQLRDMPLSP
ncbi:AAA family ATPase [Streptomyces rapamycinicus]|nr:LuxR family transcriptional regulator [Streptomyces rapamycinicus]MBB4787426.1 DNA-binding CsgD family transcriptional regulator/tetratricopeptide (TPR) repeat protein [Streptomyces rapamycinicus]UTP36854.1 AAA family ATPase [Streptomyces rapamycinicus NRRL 5491]